MSKTLDLLLTIYPFESQYFAQSSLPVTFVGNPLSEYLAAYAYNDQWKTSVGLSKEYLNHSIIALFPEVVKGNCKAIFLCN